MIRAAKWLLDILPAKLIKIIKKRKEIKNNSSKMITKSTASKEMWGYIPKSSEALPRSMTI